MWVGVGSAALLGTLVILPSVTWLRQYRYTWAALGLALVLSTFVFGVDPNGSGARLWLGFGGVFFQPSEILKILLVVFFAAYLDDYRELLTLSSVRVGPISLPPLPYLTPLLFMLAIALGTVVMQRDLGAALLLFGLFLAMLFVATGRITYVVGSLAIFVLGADLLYRLFSVVKIRVETWQDPWATASTTGYQLVQGLTALAAGGLLGPGLTYGYPGTCRRPRRRRGSPAASPLRSGPPRSRPGRRRRTRRWRSARAARSRRRSGVRSGPLPTIAEQPLGLVMIASPAPISIRPERPSAWSSASLNSWPTASSASRTLGATTAGSARSPARIGSPSVSSTEITSSAFSSVTRRA